MLEGRVGLDAGSYIRSVEQMIKSLENYSTVAERADRASRDFAKSDTSFERVAKQIATVQQEFANLRRGIEDIRGARIDFRQALGLDDAPEAIARTRQDLAAMGLTLEEVERKSHRAQKAIQEFERGNQILRRQKDAFQVVRQEITNFEQVSNQAFQAAIQKYSEYADAVTPGSGLRHELAGMKELIRLREDLSKSEKRVTVASERAVDPALSEKQRQAAGLEVVKAEEARSKALRDLQRISQRVNQAFQQIDARVEKAVTQDVNAYIQQSIGRSFEGAEQQVLVRVEQMKQRLRQSLVGIAGRETPQEIIEGFESEDPQIAAQYRTEHSEAYAAYKDLEIEKQRRQNQLEQQHIDLMRQKVGMLAGQRVRDVEGTREDQPQLVEVRRRYEEEMMGAASITGATDDQSIRDQVANFEKMLATKEGISQLSREHPGLVQAALNLERQHTEQIERNLEAEVRRTREKSTVIARQRTDSIMQSDDPDIHRRAGHARAVMRMQEELGKSVSAPGLREADIQGVQDQLLQQIRTGENLIELEREKPGLVRAVLDLEKERTKEKERQNQLEIQNREEKIRTQLQETARFEKQSLLQKQFPEFTQGDSAARARATQHLRLTQHNVASQYEKQRRDTLEAVARDFARTPTQMDPSQTVEKMLEGSLEPAQQQELLTRHKESYDAIVKLASERLRLEKSILQDYKAQQAALERGTAEAQSQAEIRRRTETRRELEKSGALPAMQRDFEGEYGRKISGFGQIQASISGEKVLDLYAQTNEKAEDFHKIINGIRDGNTDMIKQHPQLASGVRDFGKAIRTGEQASERLVAHWDNFYRLILARAVTWAFYNMTRQLESAVREASELYRAMAEVQTISKDSALTIDDWAREVRRLSDTYRMAQADIVEALYQVTSNQIAAAESALAFTAMIAPFAKATRSTMADAVNIVAAAMNSYNIHVANAEIITAQLFKTVELGRVRIGDMANQFGRTAALASQLGVQLEELNGLVAHLTITGVKYERASTYILNIMNALLKPSEAMKDFFYSINADSGEAAIRMYGFAEVLRKGMEYARGQSGEMSELFRNVRALSGAMAAVTDIDRLDSYIEQMQNAMDSMIKAEKDIFEGPGDRLLDITNRVRNVFISISQSMITDVILRLDDLLKKFPLSVEIAGGKGGIADYASYFPAVAGGIGMGMLGKLLGGIATKPAVRLMFHKTGLGLGVALASGLIYATRKEMTVQRDFDITDVFTMDQESRRKALAETYKEQKKTLLEMRGEEEKEKQRSLQSLRNELRERESLWERHYKILARGPEKMIEGSREVASFFDQMIQRQQSLFVGSAQDTGQEAFARMTVAQDIFARIGQYGTPEEPDKRTMDMAQRFLKYGQETLSFFDTKIQEIVQAGGDTEDAGYFGMLQIQREQILQAMSGVINEMAQATGTPLTGDFYANMYRALDQEDHWTQYLEDFRELSSFLQTKIQEGTRSIELLSSSIKEHLTYTQQAIYAERLVEDPVLKAYTDALMAQHAEEEKSAIEAQKIEDAIQNIGMGEMGQYFLEGGMFAQLFRAAQGLEELGLGSEPFQEAVRIRDFLEEKSGVLTPEQQEEMRETLGEFMIQMREAAGGLKELEFGFFDARRNLQNFTMNMIRTGAPIEAIQELMGLPAGFAQGGGVPGGPKGTDTVPAWLTPGEFVVRRSVAQQHGPFLEALNSGYYADGGDVEEDFLKKHGRRRGERRGRGTGRIVGPDGQVRMFSDRRRKKTGIDLDEFYNPWALNLKEAVARHRSTSDAWDLEEASQREKRAISLRGQLAALREEGRLEQSAFEHRYRAQQAVSYGAMAIPGVIGAGGALSMVAAKLAAKGHIIPGAKLAGISAKQGLKSGAGLLSAGAGRLGGVKGIAGHLGPQSWRSAMKTIGWGAAPTAFQYMQDGEDFSWWDLPKNILIAHILGRALGGGKSLMKKGSRAAAPRGGSLYDSEMLRMHKGGLVNRPRNNYQSGGSVVGSTINNYSTTANVTLQSSGKESIDARRLMDLINRESHRGTRRLNNVS